MNGDARLKQGPAWESPAAHPPYNYELLIRGAAVQMQMEQIHSMPKSKQKFITEMLDALIKQQQSA